MSTEAFCNAVMADIDAWHKANFPDLFVQYENGPGFDEEPEATAKPWLDVAVRFYNGSTTSIGDKPWGRYTGTVSMYVYARQGEGTMLTNRVIDSFVSAFKFKPYPSALLYFPERSMPTDHFGWHKVGVFIPFHLDEKG